MSVLQQHEIARYFVSWKHCTTEAWRLSNEMRSKVFWDTHETSGFSSVWMSCLETHKVSRFGWIFWVKVFLSEPCVLISTKFKLMICSSVPPILQRYHYSSLLGLTILYLEPWIIHMWIQGLPISTMHSVFWLYVGLWRKYYLFPFLQLNFSITTFYFL